MNHKQVRNIHVDIEYDEYAGRGSIWGNPYEFRGVYDSDGSVKSFERFGENDIVEYVPVKTRREAILKYGEYLISNFGMFESYLEELHGKSLGCYCRPEPCHASIVLYLRDFICSRDESYEFILGEQDVSSLGNLFMCEMPKFYIVVGSVEYVDLVVRVSEHLLGDDVYYLVVDTSIVGDTSLKGVPTGIYIPKS